MPSLRPDVATGGIVRQHYLIMFKIFSRLTKGEKIAVVFLSLIVVIAGFQIGSAFYNEYSDIKPVAGGIYTEGDVGKIGLINPLYVQYGSVTHDLTQLIFSGLTKYDPKTADIIPDLADYSVSKDGKEYTFVIKKNAKWQDGVDVTSDDVIFTYNTVIQNPGFKGLILNYNDYSGIKAVKVDDKTVKFLLSSPDSFFLVKTLPGILPAHLLSSVPVETLESDPFNQMPVGSGPYRFVSMTPMDNYTEVNLEAFEDYYGQKPNIPTIQMKVFSDFKDLLKQQAEVDGIRNVPDEYADTILKKGHLNLTRYNLPQYVAVFINTQSAKLKNDKVRLALQLGTDKESLTKSINEEKIIDTPLLEIDQKNWVYQYSIKKANGALFETEWLIPNKQAPKAVTPDTSADKSADKSKEPEYITAPNGGKDWKTTDDKITLAGIAPPKTKSIFINDYELKKYVPGDSGWSYVASFEFANLKKGKNVFDMYTVDFNGAKKLTDSITITTGTADELSETDLAKVADENTTAGNLPIRKNKTGDSLILKLVTPDQPKTYSEIASILKDQWQKIGIGVQISVLGNDAFQQALLKRDYDLLIFGQNLGYNLDAYPYWHSSQAKEGGYNLSQFKNFIVDSLLEKARLQNNVDDRKKTLNSIQEIISKEVPAIFLYSPTYYFALSNKIQNASFDNLATTSDRFARIQDWYARVDRKFNDKANPITFFFWLIKQF